MFTNNNIRNISILRVSSSFVEPLDDFIEKMLLSSPSIKHGTDGKVALTDPYGIAEQIIEIRNDILSEWMVAMEQVPVAHQNGVRGIILNKQMSAWKAPPGNSQDASGGFQ